MRLPPRVHVRLCACLDEAWSLTSPWISMGQFSWILSAADSRRRTTWRTMRLSPSSSSSTTTPDRISFAATSRWVRAIKWLFFPPCLLSFLPHDEIAKRREWTTDSTSCPQDNQISRPRINARLIPITSRNTFFEPDAQRDTASSLSLARQIRRAISGESRMGQILARLIMQRRSPGWAPLPG